MRAGGFIPPEKVSRHIYTSIGKKLNLLQREA